MAVPYLCDHLTQRSLAGGRPQSPQGAVAKWKGMGLDSCQNAAQAKLKERSNVRGGPTRKHLLSGILRCGHCGGILVGTAGSVGKNRTKKPYPYYKCKRARVSGTCGNYAVRGDFIELVMIEYFRSVWQSEAGRKSLCKALASLEDETLRSRPERRESLLAQMVKLDQQIAKGTENLLLLAPVDIPAASSLLAQWRKQRDDLQAELDNTDETKPVKFDAQAILAELDELEQHLTGDCRSLAKAAFQRVFESISLFWETVSPRRRELVRAEITPRFPFSLTVGTSSFDPRRRGATAAAITDGFSNTLMYYECAGSPDRFVRGKRMGTGSVRMAWAGAGDGVKMRAYRRDNLEGVTG